MRRRVETLTGWRRPILAAALGALSVGAFPPLYLVFLLVPAFIGLSWLVFSAPGWRRAGITGWWFGLGHFTAGLHWVGAAFLVDADRYAWMIPFAVVGLAGLLAGFCAAAAAMAVRLGPAGWARALTLAGAWAVMEWLRAWAFTGFPWNLTATVWTATEGMLQSVAVLGPYGLGLLTVWAAAAPADIGEGRSGMRATLAAFGLLIVVGAAGHARLAAGGSDFVDGVLLRLVQPNIPQHEKWVPALRERNVAQQVRMSTMPAAGAEPTHVIWAETAVPYFLSRDDGLRTRIAEAVPPGGMAIVGAPRGEGAGDSFRVWNSLHAVGPDGGIVATYDKFHLVPFGEYVPFRDYLGIDKLTAGRTDFSPGPGPRTLTLPGLPAVSPLICYEIIFPGKVTAAERPAWILNLTNDAWFGLTAGPYQHLAAARLRAVEEGLAVVRVANTGISAVIDPLGRTIGSLALGTAGVLDVGLPRPVPATPYGRFGDIVTLLAIAAALGAGVAVSRSARRADRDT